MKRSSYLMYDEEIQLGKRPLKVWGYDPKQVFVCRLEISGAGIAVYTGKKGGKCIADLTWEDLVKRL